jgi:hypothetical protein
MDFRLTADKRANWRDIMLAGSIASVINTFGMGWAFDHNFATLGGYFIGDISGMFAWVIPPFMGLFETRITRPYGTGSVS